MTETHALVEGVTISAREALVAALPEALAGPGGRTVRMFIEHALTNLKEKPGPETLTNALWQSWLDELVQRASQRQSYGTRLRYRRLLLKVAERWLAEKLISALPDLKISPQHERLASVSVQRLTGYRFSDYGRLVTWLAGQLSGCGEGLVPPSVSQAWDRWLALLLILSGACPHNPAAHLKNLTLADLPLELDLPIRWPRAERHGYIWLWVTPLCRLFVLAARYRAKQQPPDVPIWAQTSSALAAQLQAFLNDQCHQAHLPAICLEDLIHWVRLDLRQTLSNLQLSAVLGKIYFLPVPYDQMVQIVRSGADSLAGVSDAKVGPSPLVSPANGTSASQVSPEAIELDELMESYDRVLDRLRPHLKKLFQEARPTASMQALEKWAMAALQAKANVATLNVAWLVQWLLSLVPQSRLKPASRGTYWAAALRMVRYAPALRLHEMGETIFRDALEEVSSGGASGGVYRSASRRLTKEAWKSLWSYLETAGFQMLPVSWSRLHVKRDSDPARVLTADDTRKLLKAMANPGSEPAEAQDLLVRLEPLVRLAALAGLRVSEACRLRADDLDLSGLPYLLVINSKRGVSRCVSLAHLSAAERSWLGQLQRDRLQLAAEATLFVDKVGEPFDPKAVSEQVGKVLADLGLRKPELEGQPVTFHDLRAAAADRFLRDTGDIRFVSIQLGHARVTTTEQYEHQLDLQTIPRLQARPTPLNNSNLYLPVKLLADLLGRTDRRLMQLVAEFNEAVQALGIDKVIGLRTADDLPDGPRPLRPGRPAFYIRLDDALRLVSGLV